jgi:TyrR family helix-turn-helix protein
MENLTDAFLKSDLLQILNSIKDAVFVDDASGNSIWCNEACAGLYKIDPEEIHGKNVSYLESIGVFNPSVARLVLEKKEEITIVHENRDGKKLLSTGTPIFDEEGQLSKVITTSRDITELSILQNKLESMENALENFKTQEHHLISNGLIANSPAMFNVFQLIKRLADLDSTVLITGESGVGKGVVAKLLHENGRRGKHPFVKVNCGAIPENLMESELFGYEPGSFTGSRNEVKKGLFEVAEKGSIFLDEVSELPLNLQVKLLQVIQEREITRVGGVKSIPIDVRIISATNKELHNQVLTGAFREDLYYRLNVVPINVPPLRERYEDILPLIQSILDTYNKKINDHKTIDPSALAMLLRYSWPGNVREVHNIIERLVITTRGSVILPENIPHFIQASVAGPAIKPVQGTTLKHVLDKAERDLLQTTYDKYKSTRMVAKILEVSQPTVVRKLHKYGIVFSDTQTHR